MRSTMQDSPLTITSILRHGTTWYGENEAVTATETGTRRASYTEVGARCARLANGLRRLGVQGYDRVATFGWNNQEHLEAYLAVPAMGAVLHTLNIRLFAEQIVYIANHAQDRVVIVDASLVDAFAPLLPQLESVRTVLVTGEVDMSVLEGAGKQVLSYEQVLARESDEFAWPDVDESSAAAMCYTSGTTGNPKGVVYSHQSAWLHSLAVCSGNCLGVRFDDRVLPIVPMFHANAWGLPYAALMAGASLILPDRFLQPEPLVRLVETERPTLSGAVPTVWSDVLAYLATEPGHDLSSLRMIACGGSAVPRVLMQTFEERHGVPIVQAWGMTETSPVAAIAHPPAGISGEGAWSYRCTAGRLLCGVDGRLVDASGHVLPNDGKAVGELQVQGPWITGAYYRDPDPGKFDDGWLRTGDVGTLDTRGFITLTDRAKDVIKSGGEWISSVDLELALVEHPAVAEAVVVGVPDARWQERPLAIVVARGDEQPSPAELRAWLSRRMARWWLPERWAFVDAIPRTSVGKFDKKHIRSLHADGQLQVTQLRASPQSGTDA
ncbi:fatty acid--CoA ligase [Amycolatopsis sp. cmx-11-12]|uniref:fatty acid--CoA ligase n=1 Tax=Amycolatopsis sp. cmx-11-12 TaxID=2785795 RepID=UPI0039183CB0